MKNRFVLIYFLTFLISSSCKTGKVLESYATEDLKIVQLTKNTYQHISYLETTDYGKVPCNGLVFIDRGEALICDSPANAQATRELIKWLKDEQKCVINGVVATHFHVDCLGGLEIFHQKDIPSYAHSLTIKLAQERGSLPPQKGFEGSMELQVGKKKMLNTFIGEGHTRDNIVCYVPSEKVMFGGCLIKSLGAGKGNLADANVAAWSSTVQKVKETYGGVRVVVPGHGKAGGIDLLDYTIQKFSE